MRSILPTDAAPHACPAFSPPRLVLLAALFGALALSAGASAAAEPAAKKLIEFGWDAPDPKFMRQNIKLMEQTPFDGVVFHVLTGNGQHLMWETWGPKAFQFEEFRAAVDDLKQTKFTRFTENFLRVNVTPGRVDWFDDKAMAAVIQNFAVAAQIARQGGARGVLIDTEQYDGFLFDYSKQTHAKSKSFAEYQTIVRRRGRELVEAMNRHYPDITLLLTFGYGVARYPNNTDPSKAEYGLIADLFDGMLEGSTAETRIVDGYEFSYGFKDRDEFAKAREDMTTGALKETRVPDLFRQKMRVGFGIWLDNAWRKKAWDLTDHSKNHFTPEVFQKSVESALDLSDGYVWIYNEQPRWWPREKLPQPYVDALTAARARRQNAAGSTAKE